MGLGRSGTGGVFEVMGALPICIVMCLHVCTHLLKHIRLCDVTDFYNRRTGH